jgi:hypothetical protein
MVLGHVFGAKGRAFIFAARKPAAVGMERRKFVEIISYDCTETDLAMRKVPYFAAACVAMVFSVVVPGRAVLARDHNKPAVAPLPRTINLTQEQRYIIKENVKDMALQKAPSNAPETIGDMVPQKWSAEHYSSNCWGG